LHRAVAAAADADRGAVLQRSATVVTSPVGAGKTVAARAAIAGLDAARHIAIYLPTAAIARHITGSGCVCCSPKSWPQRRTLDIGAFTTDHCG
jgi:type II secretory pathway predicted ATPase ExeA